MSMFLAVLLAAQAAPVPGAVTADPPRDAAHPARNEQLLVPSHGAGMNALLFHASGAGPQLLVVLLHGLPGRHDPALAGLVLIDAGNVGKGGAAARARKLSPVIVAQKFDDLGNILAGANADTLAAEVLAAPPAWDLRTDLAGLKTVPLLAIGASEALGADTAEIAAAARAGRATTMSSQRP